MALKGFIRWIYLPLIFGSTVSVLKELDMNPISTSNLIVPGAVLVVLAFFPFLQLVGYKCIQKEDTVAALKWMEWLGYLRLLSTGVLSGMYVQYGDMKYMNSVFIVLGVYSILYLIFGDYRYKVVERVIFFIGDALFVALYFLFTYQPSYIADYDLDLFGLAVLMAIDAVLYVVRGVRMYCFGAYEGVAEVNPESSFESPKPKEKARYNKYEHDSGENLQNSSINNRSRDNLNNRSQIHLSQNNLNQRSNVRRRK